MKTIGTCLPVYDKQIKQSYERSKASHFDKVTPVMTPQWRLPSMQWNVEDDDPGELQDIELIDYKTGDSYQDGGEIEITPLNVTYDTYTISGTSVTCVNLAGGAVGYISESFTINSKYVYEVVITLTYTSGEYPDIYYYDGGWRRSSQYTLHAGVNKVWLHNVASSYSTGYLALINTAAASFAVSITSIKRTLIHSWFQGYDGYVSANYSDMQQAHGFTADVFCGAYDVATADNDYRKLTLQKTTAAGQTGYVWYDAVIYTGGGVEVGVTEGDKFYIFAYVVKTSGTLPYVSVSDYDDATHTLLSNEVQLEEGNNFIVLTVTTTDHPARVMMYNKTGETSNFNVTFFYVGRTFLPNIYEPLTDDYYQYKGETLRELMPTGTYYLKFKTANSYYYYSDTFKVDCIYPNLITEWGNSATFPYETFTSSGVEITSAIETGVNGACYSTGYFHLYKDESVRIIFFLTKISGDLPIIRLYNYDISATSDHETAVIGLNDIVLSADSDANYRIRITNTSAANWSTSEVLVMRDYSEKYIRIVFSNTCDLGDIVYDDGLEQTLWLETEPMENLYPLDEEGAKDGEGKFIRSFGRQVKKYIARTKEVPSFIIEVLYRMILHDSIELTDLVGDTNTVQNLEVEHEWLGDDKYYGKADLTFDYDEVFVIGGCCNNIT